ncbi:MAG: ATP-binding cassette domain-containing protein [Spirochaetaceae bacterium]|jgi:zinc transport system ATP-binding protein|nr:ATP-binding cassette domain-containing protein [Spirochaetaceae bacterium]
MLIACKDAAFAYEGNTVIRGLNFEVHTGDYLCIAGENGSGKSTLLKGLLGLLPAQTGTVFRGEQLKSDDIGYLPQYKAAQKDFPAGVREVVLSGRQASRGFLPFYSQADKQSADENLSRLGVGGLRNRCYRELSGGQQQRVLLARAFCAAKKLLLLDEPSAGLDPPAAAELYRLIAEINRTNRLAVIMVSHDVQTAITFANRVLHLQGEQLFWGSPAEYAETTAGKRFLSG